MSDTEVARRVMRFVVKTHKQNPRQAAKRFARSAIRLMMFARPTPSNIFAVQILAAATKFLSSCSIRD